MSNERQFLRQQVKKYEREIKRLRRENEQLRERLTAIEEVLYRQSQRGLGRAAPTVDEPGQTTLFGDTPENAPEEDAESAPAAADAPSDPASDDASAATPAEKQTESTTAGQSKRGGRLNIPEHLERNTIQLEVDPEIQAAIAAGAQVEAMDPLVTERMTYIPGRYVVNRYERQRYRIIEGLLESHRSTPLPPAIIEHGQVEDPLLIELAISNAKEFLPTYRLEERQRALGIDIPRSTLSRWLIRFGQFLEPIADATAIALLQRDIVHFDDTVFYTLVDKNGERKQGERHIGRFWSLASDTEAWFQYTPTREGHWVTTLFSDFTGTIVMDDYSGHKKSLTLHPDALNPAYCWAHVLRKFRDCGDNRAQCMLRHIRQIYHLRGPPTEPAPPDFATNVQPHLDIINEEIQRHIPDAPPKTTFGNALRYTNRLWPGLLAFLNDPRIPLDNNPVERGMRPIALRRKNSLFAASEPGAHAAAVLATIFESCKRCTIEPRQYLTDTIRQLHAGNTDFASLRPAAVKENQSSSAA